MRLSGYINGSAGWREPVKRTRPGRLLAAGLRQQRALRNTLRAAAAERADRRAGRVPAPTQRPQSVRVVACVVSGPGRPRELLDTIESILASEGSDAQVVVIDDCSVDARESIVRARFPEVDVLRLPVATGGPPQTWAHLQRGIHHALANYDFELFVRMDSDALITGPGFAGRILERLAEHPRAGLAGSLRMRADGEPENRDYHAAVLRRERRLDRFIDTAAERAVANGWELGEIVQGGIMFLPRKGCDEVLRGGYLDWRQPWASLVTDDLAMSMFVAACDLELVSIGGPDGVVAVANKHLPLPKEELAEGRWVAGHSTRIGHRGEPEADLRRYFGASRASWPRPARPPSSSLRRRRQPSVLELFEPKDGGIPEHVRVLSEGFTARGMKVVVGGPADAANRSALEAAGIRYEPLPIVGDMTRARKDIPTTARILRLLREGNFDLVHCHGMKAAFLARMVAPLTRTPVVYTPNSLVYRHQRFSPRRGARSRYLKTLWMERALGRVTAAVVAVSEEERLAVVGDGLVSGDRVWLIFNGASVDVGVGGDEELLAFRGGGPLLGFVAGLRDQKGLPTLLGALELLALRGEAVRFVIVGNGPLDGWVRERVAGGVLAGSTLVVGFGGRVEPYLGALDVFVLPSYWEGLPIGVIEAMAAGLPVVASAVGGTPEAVVDGVTGFLVPVEDVGVLADRLAEVAGDRGLRERMGAAGRERALALFSVERMVDATANLYQELVDAR